jgi:MarR family transcriptional regulator, organic hydroperoxide resistance regulator
LASNGGPAVAFGEGGFLTMSDLADAAKQLLFLYPRIYFACHTRHVLDPESRRLLSRHQASILDHLDEIDPTTVNELARHMGVTPATMSLGLDRLERKGYVARSRDGVDRRRVHVRLTTAGVRVRDSASVLDPSRVEALLGRLTDDQRRDAIRGLALLASAAQEPRAGRDTAVDAARETP